MEKHTPFKDWMGNVIKVNDTICTISFQSPQETIKTAMLVINDGKFEEIHSSEELVEREIIVIHSMGVVQDTEDGFYVKMNYDDWTINTPLHQYVNPVFFMDDKSLIAIKGVSDKKEDIEQTSVFQSFI